MVRNKLCGIIANTFVVIFLFVFNACASSNEDTEPSFSPQTLTVQGFKVLIFVDSRTRPELNEALVMLTEKLSEISRIVQPKQLEVLRQAPIWVEYRFINDECMAYHPSEEWVVAHGYPAAMAKTVEISNVKNFINWQKISQPYMVLHEFAHAYHDRVLGYDNTEVRYAYQNALESKTYETVDHILGWKERHYALTNPAEYFAELTEAYLGTNDLFPFNKSQLKDFDPIGYELMKKTWGDTD